ncbi:ATP-binding cassette domain-containing protein [Sedimentibacter sp. zth1]|nr:oligopeptide/dipeptide ABC transporter ATP-binding protein [Sedimentibacter sp. zth1]QSX07320.1 ATP-binding cassette domain-containing protein [Sedimentibacter sp. zth1]
MIAAVNESIDRLAILKDSKAYTFNTSLNYEINSYFNGIPSNKKNLNKFEKETEKVKKLAAKGKETHKVTPAVIVDLELVKSNIKKIIISLLDAYKDTVEKNQSVDFNKLTLDMIEYLGEKASAIAYRVTNTMAKNKAIKLMKEVGIAKARERYYQYPFEFSGGMRQRIVIAIALAANPDILICDEPTTALDVTIQAQILELINNLKKERELSVIFITHDLGVVANMADKIAVMYAGKVVELGTADEIFYEPAHPYTWALLASMPDLETKEKLDAIPGTPPNMVIPPVGDAFAARNKYAMQIDFEQQPPMFEISPTHKAATWLLHPNAPKVKPPKIVSDRIAKMKNINSMEVSSDEQ